MDNRTVGIIGGGQLGRMLVEAANRLNIKTVILDESNSPAKQISNSIDHIDGSFKNDNDILALCRKSDVVTFEIEHVNLNPLKDLLSNNINNIQIFPNPNTIELIKDKFIQKNHLKKNNIKTPDSLIIEKFDKSNLLNISKKFNFPYILKTRTGGYDGRGNFVIKDESSIDLLLKNSPELSKIQLYAERWVPFIKELAVMVIRTQDGKILSYPTVETIHEDNICKICYAPARVDHSIQNMARKIAENTIKALPNDSVGVFGVELFLLEKDNEILVNEIAPRPHNSGHFTINACVMSQFEAHLRAILNLPIPDNATNFSTNTTNAIMVNVLGSDNVQDEKNLYKRTLETFNASLYLYGKITRPKRKLGHINIIGSSMDECQIKANYILNIPKHLLSIDDNSNKTTNLVGIIMGSDSDLPVMSAACKTLKQFNIPMEVTIVSAHRTPQRMSSYAANAHKRGIKVIIAGAGGAAHLPGMVAAMTPLPVIGVPVKASNLEGLDSLLSIVQMPRGVPVATVAINNSMNAALLAIKMLGISDPLCLSQLEQFMSNQEKEVLEKAAILETEGYEDYLFSYEEQNKKK